MTTTGDAWAFVDVGPLEPTREFDRPTQAPGWQTRLILAAPAHEMTLILEAFKPCRTP